jgi:glycosyltransferase involved in cell wall biosynthesis
MPNRNTQTNNPVIQKSERPIKMIVLFSLGVPLSLWEKTGLSPREKAYYQHFSKQGHDVSLLTYGKDDLQYSDFWKPIRILPWVGELTHFVKYACLAPFYHRKEFRQVDVVKSNQSQGALVGVIAKFVNPKLRFVLRCGWVRTKEIIREQEHRTGFKYHRAVFFEWLGYKLANAIIVVTESDADYLVDNYAAKRNKIHVIPNAIDIDSYLYSAPLIEEKISKQQAIKLLLVGRLVEAKNFHKVLEVVAEISPPNIESNSKVTIDVTVVGEGEYRSVLEKKSESLGLNVEFAGSVANDELAKVYAQNDIVIMPEAWGSGMPKVVLEAMASGAIIIASNIRSVNQLLRSGENGFICEANKDSIGKFIRLVLSKKDKDLQKISSAARQEIENKYSMNASVEKEIELYKSLI